MRILILDDFEGVASTLKASFEELYRSPGLYIDTALSIDEATAHIQTNKYDVLIFDIDLKDEYRDGFHFAKNFLNTFPSAQIHVYTALDNYQIPKDIENYLPQSNIHHKPNKKTIEKVLFGRSISDTQKIRTIVDNHTRQIENVTSKIEQITKHQISQEADITQLQGDIKEMKTQQQANHEENMQQHKEIKERIPTIIQMCAIGAAIIMSMLGGIVYQTKQLEEKIELKIDCKIYENLKSKSRAKLDSLKMAMKSVD